jgi:hypothetical protein
MSRGWPHGAVDALVERDLAVAFSRVRTLLWFATAVAGFTVRTELLGVTSIVRALKLDARFYNALVDHFHSSAVKLDQLANISPAIPSRR